MKRRRGMTLLELTIVLLVIGIVGAVGSLKYADAVAEHRIRASALTVCQSLKEAQAGARTRGAPVTVQFQKNQSGLTIVGLPHPARPNRPNVVDLAPVTAADNYTVTFNGYGHPTATTQIELKGSGKTRHVQVHAARGAISVLPP